MNKFNRKFNNACSRIAFWDALTNHFNGFVPLLKPGDTLTPDDRQTLKDIQALLIECHKAAKARRKKNIQELQKLRKENKSCR